MMYQVKYVDMPTSIRSFVREGPDGYMTIVINPRLSDAMQRLACRHEIAHIERGDLDDARDAEKRGSINEKGGKMKKKNGSGNSIS